MDIEEIVTLSVKHKAGDLHLCSGHFPFWRREGRLEKIDGYAPLCPLTLASLASHWLDDAQQKQLKQYGQIDLAVTLEDGTRLRANFFQQRLGLSLAVRIIASQCNSLAALRLPFVIQTLLQLQEGLVLICGATGSGKSTTLSALVGEINTQQDRHIITLEDPIEFIHQSQRSLIQQREVGQHCVSFGEGLRAALREDPDVILLGELRDAETIALALTAAETGHLVLATLHTRDASQAVERLVDVFSGTGKSLIRSQLAGSLRAVIAQKLVAGKEQGRVALFEVLINTPAVANLIREGKTHQLPGLLQTGMHIGMQTFAHSLLERQQQGWVKGDEASEVDIGQCLSR